MTCAYLATASGHLATGDEEQTFYITHDLVEQGDLGAAALRSSYGIGQPVTAVPFYLAGKLVSMLAPVEFTEVIERFFTAALMPIVTAATGAVVATLAGQFGASLRARVGLALTYAFATLAWPYARNFLSEPLGSLCLTLAVLFVVRARRQHTTLNCIGAGLCVGAAAAVRIQLLLALVPLTLYLAAASVAAVRRSHTPLWLVRSGGGLILGLGVPVLGILLANAVRHGSPLDTGHGLGTDPVEAVLTLLSGGNFLTGSYGLLVSPGRGVLMYAPILFASVLAFPSFTRTYPVESVLVAGFVLAFVGFYGSLPIWAGDAAWGPRYLVPIIPVMLLPLVVWLNGPRSRVRQHLLLVLLGASIAVQIPSLLISFKTYIAATGDWRGDHARWFDAADSPIVGHLRLFASRIATYAGTPQSRASTSAAAGEFVLGNGFLAGESDEQPFPRWTDGDATVAFASTGSGDLGLWLNFDQRSLGADAHVPDLSISIDGIPLSRATWHTNSVDEQYQLFVPIGPLNGSLHRLRIQSPRAQVPIGESRNAFGDVGILVLDLQLVRDGLPLSFVHAPTIDPLPVSTEQQWGPAPFGWFNDADHPHLVDLWPWYAAQSGLPGWLALLVVVPGVAGVWAGRRLVRELACPEDWTRARWIGFGTGATMAALSAVAAVVPGDALYIPARVPFSPPGTWRLQTYEARGLTIANGRVTRVAIEYYDAAAPPIAVHFQAGPGSPWRYVAWSLPRSGSWSWRTAVLALPPPEDGSRELRFVASVPAVLRPVQLEGGDVQLTASLPIPLSELSDERLVLEGGFYAPDSGAPSILPRWMGGHGTLRLDSAGEQPLALWLDVVQPDFGSPQSFPSLTVVRDGVVVPSTVWRVARPSPGRYELQIPLVGASNGSQVELSAPTFRPSERSPESTDNRELGIEIRALRLLVTGSLDQANPLLGVEAPQ